MMKVYARIDGGCVVEIILPFVNDNGDEVPIGLRFTPEFVLTLVDITDMTPPPLEGWTYDGAVFAAPVPHVPTPQEILIKNSNEQSELINIAAQSMAPIMVSLQLGDATDDETVIARAWQAYYRALKLVDITVANPDWPVAPEQF